MVSVEVILPLVPSIKRKAVTGSNGFHLFRD